MSIDELKEIQVTEPIDLSEYEGQETSIEQVVVEWVTSKYHESGKTKVLKVLSEPVTTVEIEGKKAEIRASELFNLKQDKEGFWGYSSSPSSHLQQFMKKLGVTKPSELVGKKVKMKLRVKENKEGQDLHFLGFIL